LFRAETAMLCPFPTPPALPNGRQMSSGSRSGYQSVAEYRHGVLSARGSLRGPPKLAPVWVAFEDGLGHDWAYFR
jgi:hypothetical protein